MKRICNGARSRSTDAQVPCVVSAQRISRRGAPWAARSLDRVRPMISGRATACRPIHRRGRCRSGWDAVVGLLVPYPRRRLALPVCPFSRIWHQFADRNYCCEHYNRTPHGSITAYLLTNLGQAGVGCRSCIPAKSGAYSARDLRHTSQPLPSGRRFIVTCIIADTALVRATGQRLGIETGVIRCNS